ncbi:hypothetical protein [Streptomyces sp. NPDC047014]|uniref:hypothetical protein n=1 Tax=Streptomyces sp. NPDC047014 TaxID=3155736 RepID=UPI0033FECC50
MPMTLAVLVLGSGCVTVRPEVAPDGPRPASAAARTGFPEDTAPGLPLGSLPVSSTSAPPQSAAPEEPEPSRAPAPRKARPAPPAPAPPPRAKARQRPPAPPKSRPAPGRSYDMSALCEAAKGTVSPAIVALCR